MFPSYILSNVVKACETVKEPEIVCPPDVVIRLVVLRVILLLVFTNGEKKVNVFCLLVKSVSVSVLV